MKATRGIPVICFCFAIHLAAQVSQPAESKKTAPPDVFLITIDTLRADHVHCYGYDAVSTPALDSLAKDGIRFSQAFTPSPITNTSHTTILTGLLPSTHGVTDFAVPLAPAHRTLAQMLRQNGYLTAAFIGAIILDSKALAPGLNRGFDFYDNFPEHPQTKSRWGRVERRGMDVTQRAETWLNAHPAGPHFVWVHLYDPHDPYEPPPPFSQTYKDRLYDGEIAYADSALAQFLIYVKKQGWYDNALIVAVGDHGEGLGEHNEDTHGVFLYDSTTHVPLIVKLPDGASSGKVVEAQVRTTDILPTVLNLLKIAPPAQLDGESLQPYFAGLEAAGRVAFGETDYPQRFGWAPLRSVRAEGFKLIEAPKPEFYDLHADPGELQNKYEPWDTSVQKFRTMLADLRTKTPPAPSAGAVGQGTIDELKALGYLGRADVGSATNVPEPSLLPDPKDKIEEQNLLHKAMIASEDERPAEAKVALEEVLRLDPKSPTALRQLGELELHAGEFVRATAHLKLAREVSPQDAAVAFELGEALEKTGDLAGAHEALEASLKLSPGDFPARLLLGQVYLSSIDARKAQDQFEAALLLQPKNIDAQLGLARAQIALGNFADALEQLQPLAKSQASNADVFDLLAKGYSGLGKTTEARAATARAELLRKQTASHIHQ